jgi:hypothetical protein
MKSKARSSSTKDMPVSKRKGTKPPPAEPGALVTPSLPDSADARFVIDFADGALFVANLDFDTELWTALRAIRCPRAEGRYELLNAIESWIGRRMAGLTPAGGMRTLAGEMKCTKPPPVKPAKLVVPNFPDPVADARFVIDFADGALFVANLDFDPELWTALRAVRRGRDEGRHELLTAIASWIGRRMAGLTLAGEIRTLADEIGKVDSMKSKTRIRSTRSSRALARIKQAPAVPLAEWDIAKLLRQAGGGHRELGELFLNQARYGNPVPDLKTLSEEDRRRQLIEVAGFVENVAPADVLESALAAQLSAVHNYGMRLLRRASRGQNDDVAGVHVSRALRLIASFQRGVEVLDSHRRRGQPQIVRVERVTVNSGGQAVVGVVTGKGSRPPAKKSEPHTP